MKYKIGDVIKNTDAFGDVEVVDGLISPTSGQYCFCVKLLDGSDSHMLCWEAELNTGDWKVKE